MKNEKRKMKNETFPLFVLRSSLFALPSSFFVLPSSQSLISVTGVSFLSFPINNVAYSEGFND
jgi:hypothetical protein